MGQCFLAPPLYHSISTTSSNVSTAGTQEGERGNKERERELRKHDVTMNHKALDTTHISQSYAYTLAPPRMMFIPLSVALAAKLVFDVAVRLQCFVPKFLGAGTFGSSCTVYTPLSPHPNIGKTLSLENDGAWYRLKDPFCFT